MVNNLSCKSCDYQDTCRKQIVGGGEKVLAKEQVTIEMECINVVQDICRDCKWFKKKQCASWSVLNGKKRAGTLSVCPKKVKA
jgi:hypothetical protein